MSAITPPVPEILRTLADDLDTSAQLSSQGFDVSLRLAQTARSLRILAEECAPCPPASPEAPYRRWELGPLRELTRIEVGDQRVRELDNDALIARAERRIYELEAWKRKPLHTLGQAMQPIGESCAADALTWGELAGRHLALAELYRAALGLARSQETR